jgi:hypothetical protein
MEITLEPDYDSLDPEERTNKFLAIMSAAVGIIGFCAGLIPIAGIIICFIGIVLGYFGMKSEHRKIAIVGIAISSLGLVTSTVFMILVSLHIKL